MRLKKKLLKLINFNFLILILIGFSFLSILFFGINQTKATACTISGSGWIYDGSMGYRTQAVNGNQLLIYTGDERIIVFTFTNCGTLSLSGDVPAAGYLVGAGNQINIYDGYSPTLVGSITISNATVSGDLNIVADGTNYYVQSIGNSITACYNSTNPCGSAGTLTFTPTICSGPVSISWTDSIITANSTKIRKIHIDELRTQINNRRVDAGLANYSWTDPTITANSTKIRKIHVDELRNITSQAP